MGETIFLFREEFFANLALFDLAAFSKLTWRSVVADRKARENAADDEKPQSKAISVRLWSE